MNNGTKLRTILAIATSLHTALIATDLTGFENEKVDFIYKVASLVLNFIIVAIATYYNNDYTEIAAIKTGEMRQAKAERASGYEGEAFFEDEFERDPNEDLEVADDEE
jgi:hypothetical protein